MTTNGPLTSPPSLLSISNEDGKNQQVIQQVLQPFINRRAIEHNWNQINNNNDDEQLIPSEDASNNSTTLDTNNDPIDESDDDDATTTRSGNDDESTTRSDEDDQIYFYDLLVETTQSEGSYPQLDTVLSSLKLPFYSDNYIQKPNYVLLFLFYF